MQDLEVRSSELAQGIWAVHIRGSVDSSNVTEVKDEFDRLFGGRNFRVVADLKETRYVSSVGIGCFISAYTTAIKNGGRLVFMATSPDVHEVFALVGLTQIMRFVGDAKAALECFQA